MHTSSALTSSVKIEQIKKYQEKQLGSITWCSSKGSKEKQLWNNESPGHGV